MQEHPDKGVDPSNGKKVARSNTWFGWNTIFGRDGDKGTPYMTRIWIGRLRLHIFHRGDSDPDPHDHPWDFWTFPLTSYVEEVAERLTPFPAPVVETPNGPRFAEIKYAPRRQIVPAGRLNFRPATHCHRVLGSYSGNILDPLGCVVPCSASRAADLPRSFEPYYDSPSRKIITLVWRGAEGRKWGFLKNRDGRWCWIHWKEYVFGGGKEGPCQ